VKVKECPTTARSTPGSLRRTGPEMAVKAKNRVAVEPERR
jgi:hypothetical protein